MHREAQKESQREREREKNTERDRQTIRHTQRDRTGSLPDDRRRKTQAAGECGTEGGKEGGGKWWKKRQSL